MLVSSENGDVAAYALWKEDQGPRSSARRQARNEGMIIGIHSRDNDLGGEPDQGKQLTNVRASGTDETVRLTTPIKLTLESAGIHRRRRAGGNHPAIHPIRKRHLNEHDCKRPCAACCKRRLGAAWPPQ